MGRKPKYENPEDTINDLSNDEDLAVVVRSGRTGRSIKIPCHGGYLLSVGE